MLEPNSLRQEWIDALESGEWTQGNKQLKYGTAYCCLGVAAELAVRHGLAVWNGSDVVVTDEALLEGAGGFKSSRYDTYYLPAALCPLFGIAPDNSHYSVISWSSGRLAKLNDEGATFAEIAQRLRGAL